MRDLTIVVPLPLDRGKEAFDHRCHLLAGPCDEVKVMGNRGILSPHRPPADLVHQRRHEFLVPSTKVVQNVAWPFRMVGLMPSITQVAPMAFAICSLTPALYEAPGADRNRDGWFGCGEVVSRAVA